MMRCYLALAMLILLAVYLHDLLMTSRSKSPSIPAVTANKRFGLCMNGVLLAIGMRGLSMVRAKPRSNRLNSLPLG